MLSFSLYLNSSNHLFYTTQVYENYSFEELRYTSPAVKRTSENMLVRPNNDGTYSATWTPGSVGWYCIHAAVDDYTMEEVHILLVLVSIYFSAFRI